mmetsp:Transcript_14124/g.32961  ORF Transcript_14124/g.32961 Transcript_14124/m.32961 type:complete len:462 (-) Transcript_14124:505-1890(-)
MAQGIRRPRLATRVVDTDNAAGFEVLELGAGSDNGRGVLDVVLGLHVPQQQARQVPIKFDHMRWHENQIGRVNGECASNHLLAVTCEGHLALQVGQSAGQHLAVERVVLGHENLESLPAGRVSHSELGRRHRLGPLRGCGVGGRPNENVSERLQQGLGGKRCLQPLLVVAPRNTQEGNRDAVSQGFKNLVLRGLVGDHHAHCASPSRGQGNRESSHRYLFGEDNGLAADVLQVGDDGVEAGHVAREHGEEERPHVLVPREPALGWAIRVPLQRQKQREHVPPPLDALHRERPPQEVDKLLGHRQAKRGAVEGPRDGEVLARLRGGAEQGDLLVRDVCAGDDDAGRVLLWIDSGPDRAAVSVLSSNTDDIEEDLSDAGQVAQDKLGQQRVVQHVEDAHAVAARLASHLDELHYEGVEVKPLAVQPDGVRLGEVQDGVEEVCQGHRALQRVGEQLVLVRCHDV